MMFHWVYSPLFSLECMEDISPALPLWGSVRIFTRVPLEKGLGVGVLLVEASGAAAVVAAGTMEGGRVLSNSLCCRCSVAISTSLNSCRLLRSSHMESIVSSSKEIFIVVGKADGRCNYNAWRSKG